MKGRVLVWDRRCCRSFAGRLKVLLQPSEVHWMVFLSQRCRGDPDEVGVMGVVVVLSRMFPPSSLSENIDSSSSSLEVSAMD